jgi:phosphatidylglycerophosphate synthase
MNDLEKSEKLPPEHRYFNVSTLWIPYFRIAIRIFYKLRIPHELITLLSILSGLISAWLLLYSHLILAAVAFHLKDLFDASDGAVARLTGRGHLIGRYLDSVGDFLVINAVIIAIIIRAAKNGGTEYIAWGIFALLSLFIQCSLFNFYQLKYLEQYRVDRLKSTTDEKSRTDLDYSHKGIWQRGLLKTLRGLYFIFYSWQDDFVKAVDGILYRRAKIASDTRWYGSRRFMTLLSPLCFGTHIFVIIVFALFGKPQWALVFIPLIMNFYLFLLLYLRRTYTI